jgi:hypothetical protein
MASRREELQAHVREAVGLVRDVQRAAREAARAVVRRRRHESEALTHRGRHITALILELGGSTAEAEQVALRGCVRRAAGTVDVHAAVRADVAAVAASPGARAAAGAAAAAVPMPRVVLRAAQMLAEARVVQWLAEANARGVAASTPQLASELRRRWPWRGLGQRARDFHLRLRQNPTARRTWVRRFRQRWHVRWRRLPARADLPPEDVARRAAGRRKPAATCSRDARARKRVRFLDPFLVPP